jgi:hypothetical protein
MVCDQSAGVAQVGESLVVVLGVLVRWRISRDTRGDPAYLGLVQGRLALRGVGFEQGRCNRRLPHSPPPHGPSQRREPGVASLENLLRAAGPFHSNLGGSSGLRVGGGDP